MQTIEELALQNYQDNLQYLEKNHPATYKKIMTLETAIQAAQYKERYALEYKNEGYFDIQDLATRAWLYGQNSKDHVNHILNQTQLLRKGGVFKAQRHVDFAKDDPEWIDKSKLSFHNALWATVKVIEYHRNTIKPITPMATCPKSIFIGTGLGLHIEPVMKKLNSSIVFILEKDLELFRLSLFTTNYAKIGSYATLTFSIMDDEAEERKVFISFLENAHNHNLYIKFTPFIQKYEPIVNRLQTHVLAQQHIIYGYSAKLLKYIDSPKYIVQNYSFLNIAKRYDGLYFSDKPMLFLFSGPSTGKNIDWIIENQHRFVIVTALSTCKLLNKNGIKPDIVVHIDPAAEETDVLFEGLEEEFFEDCVILFSANIDERTVKRFSKDKIFFADQDGVFKKGFGSITAPSVGEYTSALLLVFGVQRVYLLGLDLAFDHKTLTSHSEHHPYAGRGEITSETTTNFNYRTAVEYTKGNFLDQVPTLAVYKLSIREFNKFTKLLKQDEQKLYNLGNGAYLEGATPTLIEEVPIDTFEVMDKKTIHKDIHNFFKTISSNKFREDDKLAINKEIQNAKQLLQTIKEHENTSFTSKYSYLEAIATLSWNLSDMEYKTNSCLAQVYYEYFKITISYIFDLFNTTDNTNDQNKLKEIDKILVKQLNKMGNIFVTTLEGYLK